MSKVPIRTFPFRGVGVWRSALASTSFFSSKHRHSVANTKPDVIQRNLLATSGYGGVNKLYIPNLPPYKRVALPALSPTMEMGTVVSWGKKIGDELCEGDLLCEIETDKATMGFETPEEGYLAKILISEGTKDIPIGKLLCIIVERKEDVDAFANYEDKGNNVGSEESSHSTVSSTPEPLSANIMSSSDSLSVSTSALSKASSRISATPFARKIAAEKGLNLSDILGSGPNGRILASDLQKTNKQSVVDGQTDYADIPLTNMRRTIAKRLTESKTQIPHYYLTSEVYLDDLYRVRERLNELLSKNSNTNITKLSLNDFVVKASALACMRVPQCNSFFMDTFVRRNNTVDVSVAVSTPTGLITPIIFNAHAKGLSTISNEIRELAMKARNGKLQPQEFQGGTFTVSNLGMFGSVSNFTAIINPPQSCILAVGSAEQKLVPDAKEGYRCSKVIKVTLSCDHRVVDGAIGADWLRHFKDYLEKPHTMLL